MEVLNTDTAIYTPLSTFSSILITLPNYFRNSAHITKYKLLSVMQVKYKVLLLHVQRASVNVLPVHSALIRKIVAKTHTKLSSLLQLSKLKECQLKVLIH